MLDRRELRRFRTIASERFPAFGTTQWEATLLRRATHLLLCVAAWDWVPANIRFQYRSRRRCAPDAPATGNTADVVEFKPAQVDVPAEQRATALIGGAAAVEQSYIVKRCAVYKEAADPATNVPHRQALLLQLSAAQVRGPDA